MILKTTIFILVLGSCSFPNKNLVDQLLGKLSQFKEISLPPIPQVEKNATSLKSPIEDDINKKAIPHLRDLNILYIRELYLETLGEEVDQKNLSIWMNVLEQNGSREGVLRAVINNVEYFNLFKKKAPVSTNTIEFVHDMAKRFLNIIYSKNEMQHTNFYLLKRDLAEKTLEVMDAFPNNHHDLYDWYGILSAYLAVKYPLALNFDIRKNKGIEFHRNWAAAVPLQLVKSEVIIKLLKVMNHLNR